MNIKIHAGITAGSGSISCTGQIRRKNMEFQKLIEERRTIRKYSPESRITKEDLLAVIRAAQEAPSWKNSQTGRYYCVMSEEMVEKVSRECLPDRYNLCT